MIRQFYFAVRVVALTAVFFWSDAVFASDFNVSPILVNLSTASATAALEVENNGNDAVVIQSEVKSWSQENGTSSYQPTTDILATPPIFTVPAHGKQIVRMGMRRTVDPKTELAYRLFLQEVPPPPQPGFKGVQVRLRLGVPVFIAPAVSAQPVPKWSATQDADGLIKLTLLNQGNAHIQISDFVLKVAGNATPLVKQDIPFTILAGSGQSWILKPDPKVLINEGRIQVQAFSTVGRFDAEIELGRP
ncbi:MAG: fimbria/pilus periplasmic chaperone [Gallionella sp.]|nr:fimbria/pilus periplasmic chaperone [Gallionella sp.]MDD4945802.1 fimbria/pilus periplasmic chaperone [Gallionella sp.]MDD5612805.1 fimbria/pilus periplasmic chaperone [Gallionella sp.]